MCRRPHPSPPAMACGVWLRYQGTSRLWPWLTR
jgi:hypothetical protein